MAVPRAGPPTSVTGATVNGPGEVVSARGVQIERDEGIRTDTSLEQLSRLRPAFVTDGTVTARNSSRLDDGTVAANKALARASLRKVDVDCGAISVGHPLGASGARIVGRLAHQLRARGAGSRMAPICVGVGRGLAMILERGR